MYETYLVKTNSKQTMSFYLISDITKDSADSQRKLHVNSSKFRNNFSVMRIISSTVNH